MKNIEYLPNVYNIYDNKKPRNKKTENFCLKCTHCRLDENDNLIYIEKYFHNIKWIYYTNRIRKKINCWK